MQGPLDPEFIETCHRWLLFHYHCNDCQNAGNTCEYGKVCAYGKSTFTHVRGCARGDCTYPRCNLVQNILRHHLSCKDANCEVCAPVCKYQASTRRAQSHAPSPPPAQEALQPVLQWPTQPTTDERQDSQPREAHHDHHLHHHGPCDCMEPCSSPQRMHVSDPSPSPAPPLSPPLSPLIAEAPSHEQQQQPPPLPRSSQQQVQSKQVLVGPGLFEARQRSHARHAPDGFARSSLTLSGAATPASTATGSGSPLANTPSGSLAALAGLQALQLDSQASPQFQQQQQAQQLQQQHLQLQQQQHLQLQQQQQQHQFMQYQLQHAAALNGPPAAMGGPALSLHAAPPRPQQLQPPASQQTQPLHAAGVSRQHHPTHQAGLMYGNGVAMLVPSHQQQPSQLAIMGDQTGSLQRNSAPATGQMLFMPSATDAPTGFMPSPQQPVLLHTEHTQLVAMGCASAGSSMMAGAPAMQAAGASPFLPVGYSTSYAIAQPQHLQHHPPQQQQLQHVIPFAMAQPHPAYRFPPGQLHPHPQQQHLSMQMMSALPPQQLQQHPQGGAVQMPMPAVAGSYYMSAQQAGPEGTVGAVPLSCGPSANGIAAEPTWALMQPGHQQQAQMYNQGHVATACGPWLSA